TNLVTVDGVNVGAQFTPVPANNTYSYAQINITQGNHTIQSDSGFVAYVYGYGNDESYGYAAGVNLNNLFATFAYTSIDTPICPNTPITFEGIGDSSILMYEWDFGDGTTDVGQQATHTYTNYGLYEVLMVVTRLNACGKDTIRGTIEVTGPRVVISENDTACLGDPITLTATGGQQYFWNTGETTQSITVSPTVTPQYDV